MKQRLLRLTAMLMFGCMIASSIPTGTVLAEESAQAADSAGTVQEQTETPDAGTEDPAQSSGQSDSTGAAAQDSEKEGAVDAGENSDVQTGDGTAAAETAQWMRTGHLMRTHRRVLHPRKMPKHRRRKAVKKDRSRNLMLNLRKTA